MGLVDFKHLVQTEQRQQQAVVELSQAQVQSQLGLRLKLSEIFNLMI